MTNWVPISHIMLEKIWMKYLLFLNALFNSDGRSIWNIIPCSEHGVKECYNRCSSQVYTGVHSFQDFVVGRSWGPTSTSQMCRVCLCDFVLVSRSHNNIKTGIYIFHVFGTWISNMKRQSDLRIEIKNSAILGCFWQT